MSVIDKYPFINAVLTSLSDEDLASLQECVNGQGAPNVFKSILAGSPYLLKTTDKGVYPVDLEVAKFGTAQTVYPGFLIFNDDYCVLISFATERSQILTVLDLHLVNGLWKSEIKPFELSITDLRSELFDFMGGEGGGGSGGGTVEAEPIVSIKMTNLEINGGTPTGVDTGYGLQFYCTKERWNNMVAMAKQIDSSLDITYANFGTIFSQLSSQQRIMLIAFLYYDYIDGKVLPLSTLSYDYDDGNGDQGTIALETKYYLYFEENGQKLAAPAFENPSNNNIVVQIITPRTDTVITVEEIEGASIGASGGGSGGNAVEELKDIEKQTDFVGMVMCVIDIHCEITGEASRVFSIKTIGSEKSNYKTLDNAFGQFRNGGLTIPEVKDATSFTNALNIVYTASPSYFAQALILFMQDSYMTICRTFSQGTYDYTVLNGDDAQLWYINSLGVVTNLTTQITSEVSTYDNIWGRVND